MRCFEGTQRIAPPREVFRGTPASRQFSKTLFKIPGRDSRMGWVTKSLAGILRFHKYRVKKKTILPISKFYPGRRRGWGEKILDAYKSVRVGVRLGAGDQNNCDSRSGGGGPLHVHCGFAGARAAGICGSRTVTELTRRSETAKMHKKGRLFRAAPSVFRPRCEERKVVTDLIMELRSSMSMNFRN